MSQDELDHPCSDTIRFLAVDMVQNTHRRRAEG
jgi:hypothetical protein